MSEFHVAGHIYQTAKIPAMTQFHIARKLAPVLRSFEGVLKSIGGEKNGDEADIFTTIDPFLTAIHDLSDDDSEYVINTCLGFVSRKIDGGTGWAPVMGRGSGQVMFEDIGMMEMLTITYTVIMDQIGSFTVDLPSILPPSK